MLNEQQLAFVQNQLAEKPVKHGQVKEELLDHLCSDIEFQMTAGIPFHRACSTTFATFREDEMQEIEKHFFNLNHQHLIMKKVSILALGLILLSFSIWALFPNTTKEVALEKEHLPVTFLEIIQTDPPNRHPLEENFKLSSGFGNRLHPVTKQEKLHQGVDFIADIGTPIYATSDGKVVKAKESKGGYGKHLVLEHDAEFSTKYAHLSEIKVVLGQEVKKGEIIGLVGNTGASAKPHLHYEVLKNGKAVNPEPFLKP